MTTRPQSPAPAAGDDGPADFRPTTTTKKEPETMTTHATLTAADIDAIARQIGDGAAALDSWSRQAAGGWMRPDDAREYWAHLPDDGAPGSWRVARVTVYRSPDGSRWTIGDVDVFNAAPCQPSAVRDDDQAADILAAVDADPRRLFRITDDAYAAACSAAEAVA